MVFDIGLRRVCPIHLHLLRPISSLAGVCFVLVHRLVILPGQMMVRILLIHPFMKVCTFPVVEFVVLQVSAPENRTDFTFELKILIFVCCWISLERYSDFDVCVCPSLCVDDAAKVGKRLHFFQLCVFECYWLPAICVHPHGFCLSLVYVTVHLG